MAKDDRPKSGPIGGKNRDRSIPLGGRPGKSQPSGAGDSQTSRTKDDPDTDGYSVGGRP